MAIFNSYVSLPEGISLELYQCILSDLIRENMINYRICGYIYVYYMYIIPFIIYHRIHVWYIC